MALSDKNILTQQEVIDEKYTVQFFIKRGSHAETYRVKDGSGTTLFLKLFNYAKLHRTQFDSEGNVKEIEFLKGLQHPNLVYYKDSGEWIKGNKKFAYLVLDFISGETVAQKMSREETISEYEASQITSGVLNGIKYLHQHDPPLIHNNITNHNVMLDLSGTLPKPKLIDFGYTRSFQNATKLFYKEDLNTFYLAPECFNNIFTPQSDLFSIGAFLYHMIFGLPPWFFDLSPYQKDRINIEEAVLAERKKPLKLPNLDNGFDQQNGQLASILQKALHPDVDVRFQSAEEFLDALNGEDVADVSGSFEAKQKHSGISQQKENVLPTNDDRPKGFDQISGMDSLKETVYNDVIRALEEKELFEEYGLTIPNGMLLYGPPGCGKSYFAEKFAEETGFYYKMVKSSDLASIYVHGSQEKIGQLFDEARQNAPTILCFDELDALVPHRENMNTSSQAGEVNEFLSQLNNSGKDGVFVIGTTNKPEVIDKAVLRTGRIDKMVYLPPPDYEARHAMLRFHLQERPVELGLNYQELAEQMEDFVASDIEHIVNEAARQALKQRSKITKEILAEKINNHQPSVTESVIREFDKFHESLEGNTTEQNKKIGF